MNTLKKKIAAVAGIAALLTTGTVVSATPSQAYHCKVAAIADVAGKYDYKVGATANAKMIAADPEVSKILVAGDLAYDNGTESEFRNYWRPAFGTLKSKVFAAPGNHERTGSGTDGIEVELGDNADDNRGTTVCTNWRVVALNTYKGVDKAASFLRAERTRYPNHHFIALWHEPRRSSGRHGNEPTMQPVWDAAADVKSRIVVNGHDHNYERFAQMNDAGYVVSKGTRQFVSGLGGHEVRSFGTTKIGSEKRYTGKPGVLFISLRGTGEYKWSFKTIDGTIRDSGTQGV